MNNEKETHGSFGNLIGNIIVGITVIAALLTLKSGLCLFGLLALPHIWTNFKVDWEKREFIYGTILGVALVVAIIGTAILAL